MLDRKSIAILKSLNNLAEGNAYKVVTSEEILSSLSQKSQYDADTIKQIIDFLEKQEYIIIKFSEENTYCYSLLPKARIFLEQDGGKTKSKKYKIEFLELFVHSSGVICGDFCCDVDFHTIFILGKQTC